MNRKKLGTCIAAGLITFGGATYLATPAAAKTMGDCSARQEAYAQGYADGSCQASGYSGGYVTSCSSPDPTTIDFYYVCY